MHKPDGQTDGLQHQHLMRITQFKCVTSVKIYDWVISRAFEQCNNYNRSKREKIILSFE